MDATAERATDTHVSAILGAKRLDRRSAVLLLHRAIRALEDDGLLTDEFEGAAVHVAQLAAGFLEGGVPFGDALLFRKGDLTLGRRLQRARAVLMGSRSNESSPHLRELVAIADRVLSRKDGASTTRAEYLKLHLRNWLGRWFLAKELKVVEEVDLGWLARTLETYTPAKPTRASGRHSRNAIIGELLVEVGLFGTYRISAASAEGDKKLRERRNRAVVAARRRVEECLRRAAAEEE